MTLEKLARSAAEDSGRGARADLVFEEVEAAIRSAHECLKGLFHSEADLSRNTRERAESLARDGKLRASAAAAWAATGEAARTQSVWRSDRAGKTEVGGFWCGELEADTTLESDYIFFLFLLGADEYREKIEKLARYILRQQLVDGSWNIFRGGPGEISASVKAYVALRFAGYAASSPALVRAREAILRMGGLERVNSYTKVYLSLLNLYPWDGVPALPPEVVLLPRFFYFNIYEISYWSRAILIPLSILYAKWPGAHRAAILPEDVQSIDELFVNRENARTIGSRKITEVPSGDREAEARLAQEAERLGLDAGKDSAGKDSAGKDSAGKDSAGKDSAGKDSAGKDSANDSGQLFSWRRFFTVMNRLLQIAEKTPVKPLRALALKKAEAWMVSRLEGSDGLGAIFPSMVNSVLALLCLGYGKDHKLIAEGLEKLGELEIEEGDEIRLQPCLSPVWDTALAINALEESDYPADAPEMIEAGRWLVSKEVRRPGDWSMRVRGAEVSGWAFQFRNDFYPDIDDTAAVIMALGRLEPSRVDGIEGAMERGLNWMLSLQCSNGGWAAFDANVARAVLNEVPYADHNAMLDPACADITGRVLEMFGRLPSLRRYQRVRRAIRGGVRFLRETQEENGSWYGRWGVNYIYGTWQALKGLIEVGEKPDSPCVRKAVEFLKSRQNADGGWGECCGSYDDASLAGKGASTASQTAWALMGLIAADEIDSDAADRGVTFLVETQASDGSWDEDAWTGTGFPSVFYLKYHMYRIYFPLFALGMYRRARLGLEGVKEKLELELEPSNEAATNGTRRPAAALGGIRSLFGLLS